MKPGYWTTVWYCPVPEIAAEYNVPDTPATAAHVFPKSVDLYNEPPFTSPN